MNNKNEDLQLPPDVEVLIIGNGPVGATLAALLGGHGIHTLVVDRNHDILLIPRAIALDNEALRILQLAGLAEDAFEKVVIPEVKMHSPLLGQFSRANTRGCVDGHPKLVTFYQPDLERAMRAKSLCYDTVASGAGFELENMQQDADGVSVFLRDHQGRLRWVRAKYVIGADGAHSRTRSLIGENFIGRSYGQDWLIVDTCSRQGKAIDHVEFICDPKRPTPHMPAPGGRERWEFMMMPGEHREDMEKPERIAALLAPWINPDDVQIERQAVYRFHARCCNRFQQGRIFLAGDAAHITPPFAGQGLVAGLRDAANLAWKLAWVIRGHAAPGILDSYDAERRPHARKMIAFARLMGNIVMPRNRLLAVLTHGLMRSLTLVPTIKRHIEELDIKPKNQFKSGLFIPSPKGNLAICGRPLPQTVIRRADRTLHLSDDVLGDSVVLIGLGVDPRSVITPATARHWREAGGSFLQIGLRGQYGESSTPFVEDLNDLFLQRMPHPSVIAVRPDRVVMHAGSAREANHVVTQCLALLGHKQHSNNDELSITIDGPPNERAY
ncbi:bifunctional 3-(3-hydroxy-phenyl)propionate/3-hydroxycinnamic acid hydroxylase [Pseudomonas yamanorum]|uniref:bifunctional 3-(3-hydroxy-phenyl)propionate/3-hydroxycinnamic acid hydroxylase n=1 Tax=Pseudomonas yamanorum TaxID=515393 RepID=UPI001C4677E4|nr:bifunctional 3-(3-hydroxy-phenyl)propionate/3-hydroxycinnamic acid hydroxylase [Pseudomonas yamanorum]MBV6659728.1 bifunctional 3-(3-hydroxy-phenyl)propionate/3-hydroxycinnamic acid hydroxylase [Pseudomonas yamanorum]